MSAERAVARPAVGDEAWTILRMILWSADYLEKKGVESARLDAEHLLAHVLGVERLQMYLEFERPLTPEELDGYRPLLRRRAAREPLQHILGRQPFRELDLAVDPSVLIPRPETEVLVTLVLEAVAARENLRALDVGTGSGALALSLALEGPFASVVATDVDEGALEVAKRNRASAQLDDRVEFRVGSIFEPLAPEERFDVIVSNPPYIPDAEADSLQAEVRDWEPARALFAGEDGLDVIRVLVAEAPQHLNTGGLLALEVGAGQARGVAELASESGAYTDVAVMRDYTGRERFVLAHGK